MGERVKVVGKKAKRVHIPRPLPAHVLQEILEEAEEVTMPPSTFQRLPRGIREKYGHKIKIESHRGRFCGLDPHTIVQIISLRKSGLSIRKISEITGVPKSTVHYLLTKTRKFDFGEKVIF